MSKAALVILVAVLACARQQTAQPDLDLPGADTPWTVTEYERAARTLEAVSDGSRLPRRSDPIFRWMSSSKALAAFEDPAMPVAVRIKGMMAYHAPLERIMNTYARWLLFPEVLDLVAQQLELHAAIAPLVDEFMAGFATDDPTYETRAKGRRQLHEGVDGMLYSLALALRGFGDHAPPLASIVPRLRTAVGRICRAVPLQATVKGRRALRDAATTATNPVARAVLEAIVAEVP